MGNMKIILAKNLRQKYNLSRIMASAVAVAPAPAAAHLQATGG